MCSSDLEFSNAPLKKRLSWRPRSPQREDDRSVHYLMGWIRLLAHSGLTMIGIMATCIMRGVQDDATRHGRRGPGSVADLAKILSGLYKGEEEDFLRTNPLNGFSMNNPQSWVSGRLSTRSILPKSSILLCDFDAGAAPGCGGHTKPNSTARGSGTIP